MRNCDSRVAFLALLAVLLFGRTTRCEQYRSPFVASFDRFGRLGSIEPELAGRLLLSELSCTACHATRDAALQPKLGPRLNGVGNRLQAAWVRRFLEAPQTVKPGTTMPDALHGLTDEERDHAVNALLAFLATRQSPFPELIASGANPLPHEFWRKGDARNGMQLFHKIGCVACHKPDPLYEGGSQVASALDRLLEQLDPEEIAELGLGNVMQPVRSIPHGDLVAKYTPRSLTFFLLDPAATRPAGRMPSLKLNPIEAADLAAYLLKNQSKESELSLIDRVDADVELGRRLFAELRCVNCHLTGEPIDVRPAKPLADLNPESPNCCLAEPRSNLPDFHLDAEQAKSLRAAMAAGVESTEIEPVEFAMLQLNCYACHDRDGRGGVGRQRQSFFETVGHVDLGDEGRLPPSLTGVGRKLQPTWLKKVLGGSGDIRPHMLARMPLFPTSAVARLSEQFVTADGAIRSSEREVFGDTTKLAEAGRVLLDTGCVQCHPLRGESLPSVVGVDLDGIANRVQPKWFHEFLLNPTEVKPRTRMPTFFPNGVAANPTVLDGNVDRQIAAMWIYLKELDKHSLPEKIVEARSRDFELIPTDRPVILRTFMKQAGTHAIAVGFPAKVHVAFDAESVRFAEAWRGRFLDAHATWFDRFAPPAQPLGDDVIPFPAGMPLADLPDETTVWPMAVGDAAGYQFAGYRLDSSGVPTFLYRFREFDVADRIEPNDRGGLTRILQIKRHVATSSKSPSTIAFIVNVGKSLHRNQPRSYTNSSGLTTIVTDAMDRLGEIRTVDDWSAWIIPVNIGGEATINVEYQW